MLTIDLHTHILPERWPDWTKRTGYAGWIALDHCGPGCARMCQSLPGGGTRFFREIGANCWDPAVRLTECDARGVDAQVLSTVPVMFSYWARARDALDLSRLLNDHVAEACRAHPGRFAGLGTVPMQDAEVACAELERCVGALGLAGVQIGTHVNGVNLGEAALRPVFACAERIGACVFVHPWDMLAAGHGGEAGLAGPTPAPPENPARLARYWMPWLIGMPTETCIAIYSVLASGLLDRFPRLRLGFAHGGGSFPGTIGRIQHGYEARPDLCAVDNPKTPREYMAMESPDGRVEPAKFYVDSLTHDPEALRTVLRLFSAERVALGSDYPFPLGEDRPGEMIAGMRDLTDAQRARLRGGTALEFLGAGGAALGKK